MDQELQKLIAQLQDVKCPSTLLDRVTQRIAREKTPTRLRLPSIAWAVSIAALLGGLALWQSLARRESLRVAAEATTAAEVRANRALVAQQAQDAFGYIGQALLRAAVHTENALLEEAVPPLRNGFEFAKNKVTKPI